MNGVNSGWRDAARGVLMAAALVPPWAAPAAAGAEAAIGEGPVREVRLGVAAHDRGPFTDRTEEGLDVRVEALFASPGFLRWIGAPSPHLGVLAATGEGATSYGYFGLTWRRRFLTDWYFEGGFGGAAHDGAPLREDQQSTAQRENQKPLGCRVLFRQNLSLGYRVTERISVSLFTDHVSNANLCDSNEGLDTFGAQIGYRF